MKQLTKGETINISQEQSSKLQLISIFLNNEELFGTIFNLFSNKNDKKQELSNSLICLELSEHLNNYMTPVIDYLASEFESIDREELSHLSKDNLLKIISNEHLAINDYQKYVATIIEIIRGNENFNESNEFFELFEFERMNSQNFIKALNCINPDCITIPLWRNILSSINAFINIIPTKEFLYDGQQKNGLKGIIYHLSKEIDGNVHDKGVVLVKASSESNTTNLSKNVVDFNNKKNDENRMRTNDEEGSWIEFDFTKFKIHPTHYTIRSINWGQNDKHLQNWVIEGSCAKDKGWKIIDSQNGVDVLNGNGIMHTFEIKSNADEYYRYLRLRQTGPNKQNNNHLSISALEYFGKLKGIY